MSQAQVFAEVSLLERFASSPHVTRLLEYGCSPDAAYLAMTSYVGSLAQWRQRQAPDPQPNLRMYLSIFLEVVAGVRVSVATSNAEDYHMHRHLCGRIVWVWLTCMLASAHALVPSCQAQA